MLDFLVVNGLARVFFYHLTIYVFMLVHKHESAKRLTIVEIREIEFPMNLTIVSVS